MPPRMDKTATLVTKGAKSGEPVPRAIVDTNTASVGISPQPDFSATEEISALRQQVNTLHKQLAEITGNAKASAKAVARQTQATVKLYPVPSPIAVAAAAGAFALAVAALRSEPSRTRYESILDDLRDLYDRIRDRI
jgi:phage-related tail protein